MTRPLVIQPTTSEVGVLSRQVPLGHFKLNQYQSNVTSQYGEDGLIDYLVAHLPSLSHSCCEFGAGDGQSLSNTHTLWANKGWTALQIEADPVKFQKALDRFGNLQNVKFVNAKVAARGENSLDEICRALSFDPEIGILSVDIDSIDYHVFKYLDFVRPQVAIIEFNNHIPADIDYVDDEGQVFLRCSAKALERLGKEKGYQLVACTTTNVFLVREDLISEENRKHFPCAPVEFLFDYEGQRRNGTYPRYFVPSQLNSMYPVFSGPVGYRRWVWRTLLNFVRRLVFRETGAFTAPSRENRRNLERAGLWTA